MEAYRYVGIEKHSDPSIIYFQSATTCFWDAENDRQVQIRWENKYIHCFVHLYALKTEY